MGTDGGNGGDWRHRPVNLPLAIATIGLILFVASGIAAVSCISDGMLRSPRHRGVVIGTIWITCISGAVGLLGLAWYRRGLQPTEAELAAVRAREASPAGRVKVGLTVAAAGFVCTLISVAVSSPGVPGHIFVGLIVGGPITAASGGLRGGR